MVAAGLASAEIAEEFDLTPRMVHNDLQRALAKLPAAPEHGPPPTLA